MGSIFHSQELLGSKLTESTLFAQLQGWRAGRLTVARTDDPVFRITDTPSDGIFGDCPWTSTTANTIFGRHNGLRGLAVAMLTPGGWLATDGLSAAWTAEIVEQRGDAALVRLNRI
jgi:hypothetical protein